MSYNTRQKELILSLIEERKTDFSIKEIYQELLQRNENVSQTTTYRIIDSLADAGKLRKTLGDDGSVRYQLLDECDGIGHCYLKCDNCGTIEHVDCAMLSGLVQHIKNEHDFMADKHQIILNGSCKNCRKGVVE